MSTEPARLGVPITRHATMTTAGAVYYPTVPNDPPRAWRTDGLWFATTPEAVAELRDVMVAAMRAKAPTGGYEIAYADAVLRAMGFTDA